MELTLRQLQYFLAVAETGSVKAAAQACHVSPSGISLALDELEKSLGAQVTLRSKRNGTTLTPAGKWAAAQARRILQDVDELVSSSRRFHGEVVGVLRLGCSLALSPWILPRILGFFAQEHPSVRIQITEASAQELQKQLQEGVVDACFIHKVHAEKDFDIVSVAPIHLNAVLPEDHPLAQYSEVSLADLKDEPVILLDYQPALSIAHAKFKAAGIEPNIRWTSQNAETIRSLVARGLGYALMMGRPRGDRTYEGLPLVYRRLKESTPENYVAVALQRNLRRTAVIETLITACRMEFPEDASPTE